MQRQLWLFIVPGGEFWKTAGYTLSVTGLLLIAGALGLAYFVLRRQHHAGGIDTARSPCMDLRAKEVFLGKSELQPVVTVTRLEHRRVLKSATEIPQSEWKEGGLWALTQVVPELVRHIPNNSGKWMRVIVDGHLEQGSDGLLLPFVRGNDGQIVSLARLQESGWAARGLEFATFWQVGAVVFGQIQIADINKKLSKALNELEGIKTFLHNERRSKITGSLKYLQRSIADLSRGVMPHGLANQVEDIDRELLQVSDHLKCDFESWCDNLGRIKDEDLFGSKDLYEKLTAHLNELLTLCREWQLCCEVRAANQVAIWLVTNSNQIAEHRSSLQIDEQNLQRLASDIAAGVRKRIPEIKAHFTPGETVKKRQAQLSKRLDAALTILSNSHTNTEARLSTLKGHSPLKNWQLLVRVESGELKQVMRLDPSVKSP